MSDQKARHAVRAARAVVMSEEIEDQPLDVRLSVTMGVIGSLCTIIEHMLGPEQ